MKRQPKCFARSRPSVESCISQNSRASTADGKCVSPDRHTRARTIHAHLALVLEIAFVGNDDDGERVLVLYSEDLLVERRDFFKRVAGGDRIDEEEAFSCTHVLLTHRTVLLLISKYTKVSKRKPDRSRRPEKTGQGWAGSGTWDPRTHILLDRQYRAHRGAQPRRRSHTACDTNPRWSG
jgi:hypothetical protein